MKNYLLFMLVTILINFFSCTKDSGIYYFNETGCANPWDGSCVYDSFTYPAYKSCITNYLSSEQVQVRDVSFETDSTIMSFCYACHCTTGRKIIVDVSSGDRNRLQQLGFYKP